MTIAGTWQQHSRCLGTIQCVCNHKDTWRSLQAQLSLCGTQLIPGTQWCAGMAASEATIVPSSMAMLASLLTWSTGGLGRGSGSRLHGQTLAENPGALDQDSGKQDWSSQLCHCCQVKEQLLQAPLAPPGSCWALFPHITVLCSSLAVLCTLWPWPAATIRPMPGSHRAALQRLPGDPAAPRHAAV